MKVKSGTLFLTFMFFIGIVFCQDTSLDNDAPTNETTQLTETAEPVQQEDCEISGSVQEEITSLKERVVRLLAALTDHFGEEFALDSTESPGCIRVCTAIYMPVCGSDGNTYSNECVFEAAKCENPSLTSTEGACPEEEDPCAGIQCGIPNCDPGYVLDYSVGCCGACVEDECANVECDDELPCPVDVQYTLICCPACPEDWGLPPCVLSGTCTVPRPTTESPGCIRVCTAIYMPVCGSDGNTYSNECVFEAAKCENPSLTSTEGACPEEEDPCAGIQCGIPNCDPGYVLDYSVGCCGACVEDECANVECDDELPCPVDVQYTLMCCPACPEDWGLPPCELSGTCTVPQPTTESPGCIRVCIAIYMPVCGSDGNTYSNECVFEAAKCENPSLTSTEGACPEEEDSCDKPCPRIYRPVCGSDGNTYANECLFDIERCKYPDLTSEPGDCPGYQTPIALDPCAEVTCYALPCPEDLQHTYAGNCCPECPQDWGLDPCQLSGTCNLQTPSDPCAGVKCYALPCPEDLQHTYAGNCCPECPQDWGLDPCQLSGTCNLQTPSDPCAGVTCYALPCPEDLQHTYAGNCCPECPQDWGLDPCQLSGTCNLQTPSDPCAGVTCYALPCPEDVQHTYGGNCCPECPQDWGLDPCQLSGACEPPTPTAPPPTPPLVEDPCAGVTCYALPCPEDLQHTYAGNCCPDCPEDWGLDPCYWTGTCNFQTPPVVAPTDCSQISSLETGVYNLHLGELLPVFCDFDTPHGPWMVIQRRQNGHVNFYRTMAEYQAGFGDLEDEFWFGLENIYRFVSQGSYQLRIDLEDGTGTRKFATYDDFSISDESDYYRLSVGRYSGNARNSLGYHNGMQFTTRDVDNDLSTKKNCARFHKGAWWYKNCLRSNLNGRYRDPARKHPDGLIWAYWRGYTESMTFVEMKIRRVS